VFLFVLARRFLMRAVITPAADEPVASPSRPLPSPEDLQREQISTEVARLSQEDPEAVVALLRTWMAQDED
jgi:flagellar biosynthesis/type III secretory pathway M-ring protein FliF/YscJ